MSVDIPKETYIQALKHELAGVIRSADKTAEKAIKAELDRVAGKKPETTDAPKATETTSK